MRNNTKKIKVFYQNVCPQRVSNVIIFLIFTLLSITSSYGQGSALSLGNPAYHIMDRLEIKTGITTPFHSAIRPYTRGDITRYALLIDTSKVVISSKDRADLYYIFRDNNEWLATSDYPTTLGGKNESIYQKIYTDSTNTFHTLEATNQIEPSTSDRRYRLSKKPILKYFYKTPANFIEFNRPAFHLKVNPIFHGQLAPSLEEGDEMLFFNQRGFEIRGGIDDRIYFYTNLLESQARFPDYVDDRIRTTRVVPGNPWFKNYNSVIFNTDRGVDYLNAQAHIGFNITKHVGAQWGYGRNFIGNGYRSLLLSDYGNNYFHLKLNWRVWKFHYQNIFAELVSSYQRRGDDLLPKKYMAAHFLNFNFSPDFSVGFFEAVVFSRNNHFELQYLNPVILYRTVESALGSPDNVLIGFNAKWNFLKRFQLYGQLMLDEFKFDELILQSNGEGWWANKFAIQAGLKYIDAFGIDHLDIQVEHNLARPYIYTHRDSAASYVHYNQPLAHPVGANFRESLIILRYQPQLKWLIQSRLLFLNYGEDEVDANWGNNVLLSHNTRVQDYGNELGQGIGTKVFLAGIDVSYQLFHNWYIDLEYFYRNKESENEDLNNVTHYIGLGARVNFVKRRIEF